MKKILLATAMLATLAACAEQPEAIAPTPTSTVAYQGASCRTLAAERANLENAVAQLTAAQKKNADNDAAMVAISAILFWPAAFAIGMEGDVGPQLAAAKGQLEAVQKVQAQKGC